MMPAQEPSDASSSSATQAAKGQEPATSANGSATVRAAQSATSAGICSFDVDVHYYVYYVY